MELIFFGLIALIIAALIKWPLILWAVATIFGVLSLLSKEVGFIAIALFLAFIAWYLYGGIPFITS